jgi:hypothetical protein
MVVHRRGFKNGPDPNCQDDHALFKWLRGQGCGLADPMTSAPPGEVVFKEISLGQSTKALLCWKQHQQLTPCCCRTDNLSQAVSCPAPPHPPPVLSRRSSSISVTVEIFSLCCSSSTTAQLPLVGWTPEETKLVQAPEPPAEKKKNLKKST